MSENHPGLAPRRAALAFVFITVLLDMMALGIIIPVLPKLVVAFSGGDAARGAEVYGLFGTVWALMQFVFSPVQGALSDRFGRRPVILLSNLGLGLDYILMALAPNLGWLLVGRIISGLTAASFSVTGAYVADVTPPEKRAAGFGILGSAFGVGFVLGPAIGGLLGGSDPRLPFWVAAALSLANALYGLWVLPESLPAERRGAFSWRRANPVGALTLLRSHRQLFGLAAVVFIGSVAHEALPALFVIYTTYRFGWGSAMQGLTLAAYGVSAMVVQGGLVNPVVKRLGERGALLAGLICAATSLTVQALTGKAALFLALIPANALWGLTGAASQALMTRHVSSAEQGQLQGALSSLVAIAGLIGPAMFTQVFAAFIQAPPERQLPGAPYLLAALLLTAALALGWRVTRPHAETAASAA